MKCHDKDTSLEKFRLCSTYLGGDRSISKRFLSVAFDRNVKELEINFEIEKLSYSAIG